jgi:hypothetical protein
LQDLETIRKEFGVMRSYLRMNSLTDLKLQLALKGKEGK